MLSNSDEKVMHVRNRGKQHASNSDSAMNYRDKRWSKNTKRCLIVEKLIVT